MGKLRQRCSWGTPQGRRVPLAGFNPTEHGRGPSRGAGAPQAGGGHGGRLRPDAARPTGGAVTHPTDVPVRCPRVFRVPPGWEGGGPCSFWGVPGSGGVLSTGRSHGGGGPSAGGVCLCAMKFPQQRCQCRAPTSGPSSGPSAPEPRGAAPRHHGHHHVPALWGTGSHLRCWHLVGFAARKVPGCPRHLTVWGDPTGVHSGDSGGNRDTKVREGDGEEQVC